MFSELRWEVVVGIVYIGGITISREGTDYLSEYLSSPELSLSLSLSLSLKSSGKVGSTFSTSDTWHSCYKPGDKSCIKKEPNNDYEKR
jgi:hypothetical protein